jgi:hypothetical protein
MILKQFDILAFKGNSIISDIIKKETNSSYSHLALILDDYHIVETDIRKPLAIKHINYNSKNFDIYRLKEEITEEEKDKMNEFIHITLNSKYDTLEMFSYLLYKNLGIYFDDSNKFICSSWVNECFKAGGILLSNKTIVSPQDVLTDKVFLVNK